MRAAANTEKEASSEIRKIRMADVIDRCGRINLTFCLSNRREPRGKFSIGRGYLGDHVRRLKCPESYGRPATTDVMNLPFLRASFQNKNGSPSVKELPFSSDEGAPSERHGENGQNQNYCTFTFSVRR
jgi:hypothetical protein